MITGTGFSPIGLPPSSELTGGVHSGGHFAAALDSAIQSVEQTQLDARAAASGFFNEGAGDVHTVALATQRAELSVELFQQVRNKVVQAYQEIMRVQL